MEGSGQLHTPAALTPGKELPISIAEEAPHGEGKSILLLLGIEPRLSSP
jgi:hypothetical protein